MPNESFNNIKISYGDRHYMLEFFGIDIMNREDFRHQIMSFIYKAMREFHGDECTFHNEIWKMKETLHELAQRYPESRDIIEKALSLKP